MSLSESAEAVFAKTKALSERGLDSMRHQATQMFGGDQAIIIGVNGSYARREVTQGSDIDLFFLYDAADKREVIAKQDAYRELLRSIGFKMPATDGVFSEPLSVSVLSEMIGGMDDSNMQITRRMLLLLEGEWVYNKDSFDNARERLLKQYVPDNLRKEQICLFLLNDVIRYWRTICVDFEYKVQNDGKPRAIRLIKLRFSRMMLFLAGVLAIGETHRLHQSEKITKLSELFAIPAYERVSNIIGDQAQPALELYAEFLSALDDEYIRKTLSQPSPAGEQSDEYNVLRDKAHRFRGHLVELLQAHYGNANPTLAALML